MNDLISVIVPVYKVEEYLDKCVESIVNQTYENIEILLVDDGSPDNCPKMCDSWAEKDRRIKVIHIENGGVSNARNTGIKNMTGKYFVCVDSDDYVTDDYIEVLMKTRYEFPDAGHIWCGYQLFKDDYKSFETCVSNADELYSVFEKKQIKELNFKGFYGTPWGKLYDSETVKNNNIKMNPEISLGEDMLFNYEYLDTVSDSTIVIVNKPIYCYRRRDNESLDTKYYENLLSIMKSNTKKEFEYLTKWNISKESWALAWNATFYMYERVFDNTFRKENHSTFKSKVKYNSDIMKSEDYKTAFRNFSGNMHPLYRKAYKKNNYLWVLLVKKIISIKKKVLK